MISVIIPAYNAEKTIERAVDSVRAQTYADWELIVVNDGSTDSTGAIVDKLASEDSRIQLISIPNGGAYNARLRGVDLSVGEWVAFVDSDDTMVPTALEQLGGACSEDRDVIVGNLNLNNRRVFNHEVAGEISAVEWQTAMLLGQTTIGNCAKLIRRSLFEKTECKAERYEMNEDMLLLLKLARKSRKIYIMPDAVVYNYLYQRGSASSSVAPASVWFSLFDTIRNNISAESENAFTHYRLKIFLHQLVFKGVSIENDRDKVDNVLEAAKRIPLSRVERFTCWLMRGDRSRRRSAYRMFISLRAVKRFFLG